MPTLKPHSPRSVALSVLTIAEQKRQPIDGVLCRYEGELERRDRQLVKNIVYGVLRHRDFLDQVINDHSRHPLKKMKPLTLAALRIGTYQLLFLSRIPQSAAINETVAALKANGQPRWLTGFVNGVLRAISRNKSLPDPENLYTDVSKPIFNHPEWLLKRWRHRFGREKTLDICRINTSIAKLVLRVNTHLISSQKLRETLTHSEIQSEVGKYLPDALILPHYSGPVTSLPGFTDGWFQVQDEAAQLVSFLFGPPDQSLTLLDACAGLGGKTSHLAQRISAAGSIVAIEPEQRRFKLLQENLARLQLAGQVTCHQQSLKQFATSHPRKHFQGILIDAPCSGTGVTGRHPDIRWNRQPQDLKRYHQQQLDLLQQAATLLEPDGILIYATCSMEPEENEDVVASFLKTNNEFITENCAEQLPTMATRLVNSNGFLETTPADGIDGFFAARLIKKAGKKLG